MTSLLCIDRRFNGPPDSGNGGYSCGLIAVAIGKPVKVRLVQPVPLDQPIEVTRIADDRWDAYSDGVLIATASAFDAQAEAPPPSSWVEALGASHHYAGFAQHGFPDCFVCGPERVEGDGLRIFPGSVPGTNQLAAPWKPDESLSDDRGHVKPEFIWAALDCPGYFATCSPNAALLGELAVHIDHLPKIDEPCVVTSWPMSVEGRKHRAGTALFDSEGKRCAVGVATWIELRKDGFPPSRE